MATRETKFLFEIIIVQFKETIDERMRRSQIHLQERRLLLVLYYLRFHLPGYYTPFITGHLEVHLNLMELTWGRSRDIVYLIADLPILMTNGND